MNACNPGYEEIGQLKKKEFTMYFDIFSLEKIPQTWEKNQDNCDICKSKKAQHGRLL